MKNLNQIKNNELGDFILDSSISKQSRLLALDMLLKSEDIFHSIISLIAIESNKYPEMYPTLASKIESIFLNRDVYFIVETTNDLVVYNKNDTEEKVKSNNIFIKAMVKKVKEIDPRVYMNELYTHMLFDILKVAKENNLIEEIKFIESLSLHAMTKKRRQLIG